MKVALLGCLAAGIGAFTFAYQERDFMCWSGEASAENAFVAVLFANVGPKVISVLGGDTILWLALIGIAGALIPPLVGFWVGIKVFGLNAIISDGAATGGRNSTPSLNAIMEEFRSSVAAVPYPVAYAFTTVLALIGALLHQIRKSALDLKRIC